MSRDRMLAPPISTVGTMIRTKPATSRDCGLIMSLLSYLYLRRCASCHRRERCALSEAYSPNVGEEVFSEVHRAMGCMYQCVLETLAASMNHTCCYKIGRASCRERV